MQSISGYVNGWRFKRGSFAGQGKVKKGGVAVFTPEPGAPFLRNGTIVMTESYAWNYTLKVERQLPSKTSRYAKRHPSFRPSYVVVVVDMAEKALQPQAVRHG